MRYMSIMKRLVQACVVALALCATGCSTTRIASTAELHRADPQLLDPADGRAVPLHVVWPAHGRRMPVILYSHGAYSSKDLYGPIVDAWAARGYVVIAPTHRDSVALGVRRGTNEPRYFAWRLEDMELILARLDAVFAQVPGLAECADPGRIVAAGHSFGGLVAQTLGGATYFDPSTGATVSRRDARVRAVIIFSGAGPFPPILRASDFATLTPPTLVTVGTNDLQQAPGLSGQEWRKQPYDLAPSGSKFRLTLDGADHYLGGTVGRDDLPRDARGPAWLAAFNATTCDFLDAFVKGKESARRKLLREAAAAPASDAVRGAGRLETR
jgi:dienelactone hydrolase